MAETLKSKRRRTGDVLIGIGTVVTVLAFALVFMTAASGGSLFLGALFFGGLMMIVIGYLQRIAAALDAR